MATLTIPIWVLCLLSIPLIIIAAFIMIAAGISLYVFSRAYALAKKT